MGLGVDLGITESFGIVAQVGYHNMLAGGDVPPAELAAGYGLQRVQTSYHSAFGWLAATAEVSSVQILLGPTFDISRVKTQGLNASSPVFQSAVIPQGNVAAFDYVEMSGNVKSAGVSGGMTMSSFDIGSYRGGISALLGAHNDTSRWYSWGQLAFTVYPENKSKSKSGSGVAKQKRSPTRSYLSKSTRTTKALLLKVRTRARTPL